MLDLVLKQMNQISASFIITSSYKISYAQHLSGTSFMLNIFDTSVMFNLTKKVLFAKPQRKRYRDPWPKYAYLLSISIHQIKKLTQSRSDFAKRRRTCIHSPPWSWYDVQMENKTSTSEYYFKDLVQLCALYFQNTYSELKTNNEKLFGS